MFNTKEVCAIIDYKAMRYIRDGYDMHAIFLKEIRDAVENSSKNDYALSEVDWFLEADPNTHNMSNYIAFI